MGRGRKRAKEDAMLTFRGFCWVFCEKLTNISSGYHHLLLRDMKREIKKKGIAHHLEIELQA